MNRLKGALVCLFILWLLESGFGAESAEWNRVRPELMPGYTLSLHTVAGVTVGENPGEHWRIGCTSEATAEIALFKLLFLGVSLPWTVSAGYPWYDGSSFDVKPGPISLEIGVAGVFGAVSLHGGAYFIAADNPAIGGTVSLALIRDPIALKATVRALFASDLYSKRVLLRSVGCMVATLVVLNDALSLELGIGVDVERTSLNLLSPPTLIGTTGVFIRRGGITVSCSLMQSLWEPRGQRPFQRE